MIRRVGVGLAIGFALVLAACSGRGSGAQDVDDDATSQLHAPAATVAAGEVWVIGGAAGPEGSTPPVSSDVPEGWGPNPTVTRYAADGEQLGRYRLPPDVGSLLDPAVIADGDRRFLVASSCGQALGCGSGDVENLRFELVGDDLVRRPLDLPPVEVSSTVGNGMLRPIGPRGPLLWALQQVPSDDGAASGWTGYRLLEIDAIEGTAVELPLPPGPAEPRSFCILDDALVFAQPTIVDGLPGDVTIFRQDRHERDGWRVLAHLPPSPLSGLVSTGCLPDADEVVLVRSSLEEAEVLTLSASTGSMVAPVTPMVTSYLDRFFELDGGRAIGVGRDELGRSIVYARDGTAGWTERRVDGVGDDSTILLVDGSLYDVAALLNSTTGGRIDQVEVGAD